MDTLTYISVDCSSTRSVGIRAPFKYNVTVCFITKAIHLELVKGLLHSFFDNRLDIDLLTITQ